MTVRAVSSSSATNISLTTTSETAIVTTAPISTRGVSEPVQLAFVAQLTLGTGTTAVTPRVRRGSGVAGAVVGEGNPINGTAGQTLQFIFDVTDEPGDVAKQRYTFTLQQTGASADGTALYAAGGILVGR